MKKRFLIVILFTLPFYLISSFVEGTERMKQDALSASGVNLYKIDQELKDYSTTVAHSVNELKKLSTTLTGNPNNYKIFLDSLDIQNTLAGMQSNLLYIFEAYGLPNEVLEKKMNTEKEIAVQAACKPKDQTITDIKNIMNFNVEGTDLATCHDKLKWLQLNLKG